MLSYTARLIVFAVVTLSTVAAPADWFCDLFNSAVKDTKRRNCWPAPFQCPDRQTVRTPFAVMVNNGWRKQNMLSDFHFEPTTGKLTEAGQMKIRWIMFEAPEQHRAVFIHMAKYPEETESRLAAVHEYVASVAPQKELPPISVTTISDEGAPADRIDMIGRKYQASTPNPRLPSNQSQGSSSGSAQ